MSTWVDEGTYVYYDGNVGIGTGTTAPGAPLEVSGASIFDEPMVVYDNSSSTSLQEAPSIVNLVQEANAVSTWSILGFGGGYNFDQIGRIGFQLTATGDEEPHVSTADFVVATASADGMTEQMRVTSGGNVGIGTASPAGTLDVRGGTAALGDGVGITLYAQNGQASGDTDGGNIILMPGAANGAGTPGRVGIGTASPAHTLDVSGDGNFSAGLYVNGTQVYPGVYPDTISSAWLQTLSGMTYCHRVIYAYGYWWAFGYSQVYRVSPSDGTPTACTGVPAQHIYDAIAVSGKLYYTYGPLSGAYALHVDQIDPATLIATNVINDGTHCAIAGQNSMCSDGTYLWVTTWDYSAGPPVTGSNLLKYTLAGVYQATCAITDGAHTMQLAHCCRYDGTRIIATSAASTANLASFGVAGAVTDYLEIAFIDPAAMTVSASHVFPSNADAAFTDTFAVTQNFVWCGSEESGNLVKFAKADLTIRTVLPTGALASGNSCYEVYNDGRFLWMGFDVAGVVVRVNPFTGALNTFALPLGQPSVNSIWADDAGQNICFGNWLSSGAGTTALSSTPLAALQVW